MQGAIVSWPHFADGIRRLVTIVQQLICWAGAVLLQQEIPDNLSTWMLLRCSFCLWIPACIIWKTLQQESNYGLFCRMILILNSWKHSIWHVHSVPVTSQNLCSLGQGQNPYVFSKSDIIKFVFIHMWPNLAGCVCRFCGVQIYLLLWMQGVQGSQFLKSSSSVSQSWPPMSQRWHNSQGCQQTLGSKLSKLLPRSKVGGLCFSCKTWNNCLIGTAYLWQFLMFVGAMGDAREIMFPLVLKHDSQWVALLTFWPQPKDLKVSFGLFVPPDMLVAFW